MSNFNPYDELMTHREHLIQTSLEVIEIRRDMERNEEHNIKIENDCKHSISILDSQFWFLHNTINLLKEDIKHLKREIHELQEIRHRYIDDGK